jgi:SAM-dependent methyltransferase
VGQADGADAVTGVAEHCFVCSGSEFDHRTASYRRCRVCGHETLVATQGQTFIVNDHLSMKEIGRVTSLDRFKAGVLARFDRHLDRNRLLDIGSGSGKFLFHNGSRYAKAAGIEITAQSLDFSRSVLGLDVVEDIDRIDGAVSVATAWHSFEHIPEPQLVELLERLAAKMGAGGRLIVSVPNGASRQYAWFGDAYAYFDAPNHLHQFTPDSLNRIMRRYGFRPVATVVSWPYNTFGYTQSLLNVLTRTHNYLYYRLKRRSRTPSLPLDLTNALLLFVAVPLGWVLGSVDAMKLESQGVITACFENGKC